MKAIDLVKNYYKSCRTGKGERPQNIYSLIDQRNDMKHSVKQSYIPYKQSHNDVSQTLDISSDNIYNIGHNQSDLKHLRSNKFNSLENISMSYDIGASNELKNDVDKFALDKADTSHNPTK